MAIWVEGEIESAVEKDHQAFSTLSFILYGKSIRRYAAKLRVVFTSRYGTADGTYARSTSVSQIL
jgi:hypothetical protein